ncbi:MAG TPA: HAMP domain-containing sensor histidine kinase [Anaerolineae bacterium]|nr:HAMP domain-containing sensor histidine kinase [Anaerolineae bacterium]
MMLSTRLTLWHVSLLTLLLTAFAVISYQTLDSSLRAEMDRVLRERADHAALAMQAVPSLSSAGISPDLSGEFASPGIYAQVLDEAGRIIARSANLGAEALPIHEDRLAEVLAGRSFYDTESIGGQNARLYHRPIVRDGLIVGAVQVGGSLHNLEDTLTRLGVIFVASILAALVVACVGSHVITRVGLRPLTHLADHAAHIGRVHDLSARVPYASSPDEAGRLAVTFNGMLTRLEAAFKAQQHFLAEAAHELRTPLASLLGNADLLVRYGDDPYHRAIALSAIRAEGRRTSRLLSDLLLSVQADAGWRLELRPTPLAEVLCSVVENSRLHADGVAIALADPPPITVLGDADRLKQVFFNLVDNALRHTPSGGEVSLRASVDEGGATVTITDTGEGIPPDALPHIFDRFYRAPSKSRGSGLGLAIARWIVEQHGGHIEVKSEIGRGSTFGVWLPAELTETASTSN